MANDPRQAFAFCAQTGGLLVVQYAGQEWLPVVRDLRSLCGEGISLVVAVSPDKLMEVSSLQHAGADEVVPWEGKADAVAWAIERVLSARGPGAARSTPTPLPPVVTYVAPADSPPPKLQRGPTAPAIAPARPPASAAGAEAAAAPAADPVAAGPVWPATIPGSDESDRLLAAAVAGSAGEGSLFDAAARAAQKHSLPEREAMAGGPLPVDAGVVRRAAVLRFRVAVALQAAPRAGEPYDAGAVQALLAEIDGVLAELKALGEGAPPEVQPGLDALRSGLVSEAIDLTEAVQRLGPGAPMAEAPRSRPSPAVTRVTFDKPNVAEPERRGAVGRGWIALLVVAALAAGGYHGWQLANRPRPVPPATYGGAPAGTYSMIQGRARLLKAQAGKTVNPAELEKFRAQEQLKGNVVREIAPGIWTIEPAAEEGKKP